MCVCVRACMYVGVRVCDCLHVCVCVCVRLLACVCVCVCLGVCGGSLHVWLCVCVCVCVRVWGGVGWSMVASWSECLENIEHKAQEPGTTCHRGSSWCVFWLRGTPLALPGEQNVERERVGERERGREREQGEIEGRESGRAGGRG